MLHNHPAIFPGGAEMHSLELFEALAASDAVDPILVARADLHEARERGLYTGATFKTVEGDPRQYFMFTEFAAFDPVLGTSKAKWLFTQDFPDFLLAQQPDVVHFQHTHMIGYDVLTVTRRVLPRTPIVYTLHEFLPICLREGQMIRTERKGTSSAHMRRHGAATNATRRFLRRNFSWREVHQGSSRKRRHVPGTESLSPPALYRMGNPGRADQGRGAGPSAAKPGRCGRRRATAQPARLLRPAHSFQGRETLLEAMRILAERQPDVHLSLHGAYVEYFAETYGREFLELVDEMRGNVTYAGAYDHSDLPRLMRDIDWVVVPSLWWENSPLVVQEAFMHCRPVICSGIGGLAEKVQNEVNGLHFTVGDPGCSPR